MEITKEIEINSKKVWLKIVKPLVLSNDSKNYVETDFFMCYYKLSEPNDLFYGELIKNEFGASYLFKTPEEAIHYATEFLAEKLIDL